MGILAAPLVSPREEGQAAEPLPTAVPAPGTERGALLSAFGQGFVDLHP